MAPFTFALLATLTVLVSASPITLDTATLALNGQKALVQNCQFRALQQSDTCNNNDTACVQGGPATCVNNTWQLSSCPSTKSCFALPQLRANGTFIACTSLNNAASIIAATGIQTNIANNCTSPGDGGTNFPFNNAPPGDGGNNNTNGTTPTPPSSNQPPLTIPPFTTTLSPAQVAGLNSLLSVQGFPAPTPEPGRNPDNGPPVILLTTGPVSPAPNQTPQPRSPMMGGY